MKPLPVVFRIFFCNRQGITKMDAVQEAASITGYFPPV